MKSISAIMVLMTMAMMGEAVTTGYDFIPKEIYMSPAERSFCYNCHYTSDNKTVLVFPTGKGPYEESYFLICTGTPPNLGNFTAIHYFPFYLDCGFSFIPREWTADNLMDVKAGELFYNGTMSQRFTVLHGMDWRMPRKLMRVDWKLNKDTYPSARTVLNVTGGYKMEELPSLSLTTVTRWFTAAFIALF